MWSQLLNNVPPNLVIPVHGPWPLPQRHHVTPDARPTTAIVAPVLHQSPAPLKQVAAPIRLLNTARNCVRQRLLNNVMRVARLLVRPIVKRGPKPMRGVVAAPHTLKNASQAVSRHWRARVVWAGENEIASLTGQPLEDFD